MPLVGIDEEGLPHNPDLQVAQLKFLLTLEDEGIDKKKTWDELLGIIKEKCKIVYGGLSCIINYVSQLWLHFTHLSVVSYNIL